MDLLFVEQEILETGCGIAVLAMLLRRPFKIVSDQVNELGLCKPDQKVTVSQMKSALKLIFDVDKIQNKRALSFEKNENYVCYCRWEGGKYFHWIIYANGMFYDPTGKNPVPVTKHRITSLYKIPDKPAHSLW